MEVFKFIKNGFICAGLTVVVLLSSIGSVAYAENDDSNGLFEAAMIVSTMMEEDGVSVEDAIASPNHVASRNYYITTENGDQVISTVTVVYRPSPLTPIQSGDGINYSGSAFLLAPFDEVEISWDTRYTSEPGSFLWKTTLRMGMMSTLIPVSVTLHVVPPQYCSVVDQYIGFENQTSTSVDVSGYYTEDVSQQNYLNYYLNGSFHLTASTVYYNLDCTN